MNEVTGSTNDGAHKLFKPSAQPSPSLLAAKSYGKEQKEVNESGKDLPNNVERLAHASEAQVKEAVSKLNEYAQSTERTLDFQLDEDSGKAIIKVFDTLSAELIRQIPNELALELARNLNDEEPSVLFSAQV